MKGRKLLGIYVNANVRPLRPFQLDREHVVVADIWRDEEAGPISQLILPGLNVVRIERHRNATPLPHPLD